MKYIYFLTNNKCIKLQYFSFKNNLNKQANKNSKSKSSESNEFKSEYNSKKDHTLYETQVDPSNKRMSNTLRKNRMKLVNENSDQPELLQKYLGRKLEKEKSLIVAAGSTNPSYSENTISTDASLVKNNDHKNTIKKKTNEISEKRKKLRKKPIEIIDYLSKNYS